MKLVLLILVGVVVLPLGSCGALGGFLALKAKATRDVTEEYLGAIQQGRFEEAYALTCARLRFQLSSEEFTSMARGAKLAGFELGSSTGYSNVGEEETATVEVILRSGEGRRERGDLELRHEDGWRMCPVEGVLGLGESDDPEPASAPSALR